MLSTLARVGEISKARWVDVNFEAGEWTIPKENSKNGIEHVINLSHFALHQFRELRAKAEFDAKQERPVSDFVLPATRYDGHVCEKSLAKQLGDRQRGERKRYLAITLSCRRRQAAYVRM